MNILLLSPNQLHRYNWGHQLFRNEIGRQHDVLYYGDRFPNFNPDLNVPQIINQVCEKEPDLIITYGWRYSKDFKKLGKVKIPKVHITVDYGRPVGIPRQNEFFSQNKYDLVFAITQNAMRLLKQNKVCKKIRLLPFSVDTNVYKKKKIPKVRQVLASFTARSDIYPNRNKIRAAVKSLKIPMVTKKIIHGRLINAINKSKVIVTSNNIFRSLSMRYTETLACGGFLLADKPEDLKLQGFVDGKHLVIYKDIPDFKDKLLYYLSHDEERSKIEKQGMDFVRKNHSCEIRVKQMTNIIKEELNIE